MKGHRIASIIVVVSIIISLIGIVAGTSKGSSSNASKPSTADGSVSPLQVALINDFTDTRLPVSISLEPSFNVTDWTSETFLENLNGTLNIDVLVLGNVTFSPAFITGVKDYLETKNGRVFFIMGNSGDTQGSCLMDLGIVTSTSIGTVDTLALWSVVNESHPLVNDIGWNSIPEARYHSNATWQSSAIDVLLESYYGKDPMLLESKAYFGRLIILTAWTSLTDNRDFELSPYFNYFIYHTVQYLGGRQSASYADWLSSPVPHMTQIMWIYVYLLIIAGIGITAFFLARRRSKKPIESTLLEHALKQGILPEAATEKVEELVSKEKQVEKTAEISEESLIEEEKKVFETLKEDTSSEWEKVGMHRQISGFFINLLLMFIIAVPSLLLTQYVYPRYVQPYAQVQGWSSWTGTFFSALYTIFDLGTGTALVKYFSEYRIKNPAKAIRYAQLFIYWQMLTGVVQITIVSSLGIFAFSHSDLGHMTWFFILASLGQFPGMLGVISSLFQSMQRFDIKQITDVVAGTILNTLITYACILMCRSIFAGLPVYGEAFGAAVGMSIGGIFGSWNTFMITALAFKHLGFKVRTLFRADFGKAELKEALSFGWKLTVGNMVVPLVGMLEASLVAVYVLNYNSELGYYNQMASITGIIGSTSTMFDSVKPAISEAYGNKKMKLVEYYAIETFRWMNTLTFVLFGVILAVGAQILVGFSGTYWIPATKYLLVLCMYKVIEPYAWYGDVIFQGTGKTQYNAYVWFIEQGTRATLLLLILPGLNLYIGVILAYIPALIAKSIAIFTITRKKIVKFDWCFGHTVLAPVLSTIIIFFLASFLANTIWQGDTLSSIFLLLTGIFGCVPTYFFLIGFFGGWDQNTLFEFKRGLAVNKQVKAVFFLFYKVTEIGHNISPLKNKFQVKVYDEARAEAIALTEEKKKLVI